MKSEDKLWIDLVYLRSQTMKGRLSTSIFMLSPVIFTFSLPSMLKAHVVADSLPVLDEMDHNVNSDLLTHTQFPTSGPRSSLYM